MNIECIDPLTGIVEYVTTAASLRENNAEDEETLEAVGRMERGESTVELVGFNKLRVVQ